MKNETDNDAYRDSRCIDCKEVEHSAGRPRCDECHAIYVGEQANGWRP